MNKKIIILLITLSLIFSSFLYFNYNKTSSKEIKTEKIYFLQVAAFGKYENVSKLSRTLSSYLVIQEEELYHIYIAITKNDNNLIKLKEFYKNNGNNIYIKEKVIQNSEFIEYLKKYDFILENTNDKESILSINKSVLKKYEEIVK